MDKTHGIIDQASTWICHVKSRTLSPRGPVKYDLMYSWRQGKKEYDKKYQMKYLVYEISNEISHIHDNVILDIHFIYINISFYML